MDPDSQAVHDRWVKDVNRRTGEDGYREEWYWEQCADCRHWCPLAGSLGEDWGVCANPTSAFDSRVRFEHDGCEAFEPRQHA
jgi:hypothetical protein